MAFPQTIFPGELFVSCTIWFLLYQIIQATPKSFSRSLWVPFLIMSKAIFDKSHLPSKRLMGQSIQFSQTFLAISHFTIACSTNSASLLHGGQRGSTGTPLLLRLSIVGIAFMQSLQAKILTFAGMFKCRIFFHKGARTSLDEDSPCHLLLALS